MSESRETPGPGEGNWVLIRWLLSLALKYRMHCLLVLGLQLVLLLLGLAGLSFSGYGIDFLRHRVQGAPLPDGPLHVRIPEDWTTLGGLLFLAGLILLMAVLRSFLNYRLTVETNLLVQQKLVVDLRGDIYDRLQSLSFRFYDANTTGSIITRVTGDVQSVRMFVDQVLIPSVIMVVSLVVYIVYMASLSPSLTAGCLATIPVLLVMSVWFSRHIQPRYAQNRNLVEKLIQRFTENLGGMGVVKGFGREAEAREEFEKANREVYEQQRSIFWRVSLYTPAVGFLTRVNMMVLLGYGGWLVIHGQLPLGGGLIVFAGLLEQFSGQVNNVANIVNSVQQSLIGARRVRDILTAPVEVRSKPGALPCRRLRGEIRFEKACFAYDGVEQVLSDIELEVRPGQCVAILGATGAGKSVLMSLVPRFHDVSAGRILIDGRDVRDLDLAELRRNIGIVFQESFLFSNSVAANIAFGRPHATMEQIEKAARVAAAHDFILALPQGYDTVLGEGGGNLSGGQRQRLAIARAVLLEPAILLLDDPTAAIDSQTEQEIFEALERAISGRSTFIVAHRVSTLRRADLILVMERGRIVQRGTHEQLLREPGPYRRVASLQLAAGERLEEEPSP